MPVYNEYHTIESCLERVLKADVGNLEMEVIISNNNSNDATKEILHKISDQSVKILYRKENNGKVANIKNALKEASGDLTLFQDGDLEYSPNDYLALLELFFLFSVDVVYGSRLTRAKATAIIGFPNYIGNILFTFFANFLFNKIFTDIATGSKVFKKNIIKNLEITSDGFEIEPEITAKYLEIKKLKYLKSQL
jgi:glycosyltransferase involved in cell wall biosynthesis